jgi:O-antigen/teichoic acid export membrane protein
LVSARLRWLLLLALPFALAVALGSGVAASFLHTHDYTAIALAGASLWLLVVASVGYGGLQGVERFRLLGIALIVAAGGRVALGVAFAAAGLGVDGAMLAVTIGLAASATIAIAPHMRRDATRSRERSSVRDLSPMLPALIASIAIAIPTSADVILVRHYFPSQDAGAYAAVSTLGKIVVFGPLAISLALFPEMVRAHSAGTLGATMLRRVVATTGIVAVPSALAILLAYVIAPGVIFAGYNVPLSLVSSYLGAMLAFSLTVALLYFALARRQIAIIAAVPAGLAIELAAIAAWHPSATAVAAILLTGNVALLIGTAWRCLASPATQGAADLARLSFEEPAAA